MIGILTDFGAGDPYAGIVHGMIKQINPNSQVVDLCHDIPPQNLLSAGFALYTSFYSLGPGWVFLVVVDPGVGSDRGILVAEARGRTVIAPDNGLLTLLRLREPTLKIHRIDLQKLHDELAPLRAAGDFPEVSGTFHGRDVFAPLAALWLSGGKDFREHLLAGKAVHQTVELSQVSCGQMEKPKGLYGYIIHFDHFGNAVVSIRHEDLPEGVSSDQLNVVLNPLILRGINTTFSSVPAGAELAYWGSSGFLEIGVNLGNARKELDLSQGDRVELHIMNPKENPWPH